MTDTWLADLMITVAEWARDVTSIVTIDIGGYIAASSGAAHELEFYGGGR